MNLLESDDEKLFKPILNMMVEDSMKAVKMKYELTKDQQIRFDKYMAVQMLYTESSNYRGKIIGMCAMLELILAKILSYYFTSDQKKRDELNYLVFDRMDLSQKYHKFKKLIRTRFPKIWKEHQLELKEIEKLIEFRNELAHSILDTTEEGIERINNLVKEIVNKEKSKDAAEEIQIMFLQDFEFKKKVIRKSEIESFHKKIVLKLKLLEEIAIQIIEDYK